MNNKKVDFNNLSLYFYNLGLKKYTDYSVDIDNKIIGLNNNRDYCVSILEDKCTFEVFKSSVGAKFNEKGIYLTDGELHSYKTFKSLNCALKFALDIKNTGVFPKPEIIY